MANLKRRAQQLAQLQFMPEVQTLLGLKRDAKGTYRTEVAQAIGTAAGLKASAKAARPETRRVYSEAEGTRLAANKLAQNTLAGLPADSPFRAAFGIEDAGARTRFGEARAGALHELTQRILEADAGRAYDLQAAGQHRRESLSKIGQQLVGVRGQQGLATATTLSGLRADRAKQQATAAHQQLADAIALGRYRLDVKKYYHPNATGGGTKFDRLSARDKALTVLGSPGVQRVVRPAGPKITPAQQGSALTQLNVAVRHIQALKGAVPQSALRGYLETGYKTKNSKIPQIKSAGPISSRDIINAAFDIATFGSLSTPNRRAFRGVRLPSRYRRRIRRVRSLPGIPRPR